MNATSPRRSVAHTLPMAGTFTALLLFGLIVVVPFAWIVRGAFSSTDAELYVLPPTLLPSEPTLENFHSALTTVPMVRFFVNSLIVAGTVTFAQLATSATAAYAFARIRFRGSGVLFAVILSGLMIPVQATIVPLFLLMRQLHLTNTLWSLILPPVVSAFGIFLLRQHFIAVPRDLDEAARIDGAGHVRIFAQVMLPLSGPALATLGIICFTFWWNDLLLPMVMITDTENQTLPVGLTLLAGRFSTGSLGTIAAGITLAVVPVMIVFAIFQRHIVQSIAASGIKL